MLAAFPSRSKRLRLLCACSLAMLPLSFSGAQSLPAKPPVVTMVYADYKPYSWKQDGVAQGLEIDILQEVLGKRMGLPLQHQILPWERAQQHVETGLADAFVATPSARRNGIAEASREAVTSWDVALYWRKGDPQMQKVSQLSDLKGLRIGSLRGNNWVQSNFQGMQVHYVGSMESLPTMLLLNRIDVIPDNPLVMRALLKQGHFQDRIEEQSLPTLSKPMYLFVGLQSPLRARLGEFDSILRQMKQDGSLQKIYAKYYGDVVR